MRRSLLFVLILATAAAGDDWTQLGLDDARTRVPSESIASPALVAVLATGSPSSASPVAADGYLLTAGQDGMLRAWRESDRLHLWTADLGGPLLGTPAVVRGRVYAASTDGTFRVLRLADGAVLWSVATGGADQSSPLVTGGRVVFGTGFPNTAVYAYDALTGVPAWSAGLDQVMNSSAAVAGGRLVAGCSSGTFTWLDAATGAVQAAFPAGDPVGQAAPLIDGTSVYLPAGATLRRTDLDPANWGAADWAETLADPLFDPMNPPAGLLGSEAVLSSPAKAGALVVLTIRFTYHLDQYGGDGLADVRILRDFAAAFDPAAAGSKLAWQALLGEATVPNVNGVPPYRVSPSPVSTGSSIAFASGVQPLLRLLSPAGADAGSFALDAPCLASPMLANARLYALSTAGTLHVFQGTHAPPGAVGGMSPSGLELAASPATLSWTEAEPGATYAVRIDDDGEVLMDWDVELAVAGTATACPPLGDGAVHTWAVRARDADGARGPWQYGGVGINVPVDPPGGLAATPKHEKVVLRWTRSPSPGVTGYRLTVGPAGGPPGPTSDLGNVTSTVVPGLVNGAVYQFEVRAVTATAVSLPATLLAAPVPLITVGGTGFDTLQAAAAGALPGQTIQLGEDVFTLTGTVALPAGVGLSGVNAHVTRILASGPFEMVVASGGNTVRLVTLAGGSLGVRAVGAGVVVANCVVRDQSGDALVADAPMEAVNDTIVGNAGAAMRATAMSTARNLIAQSNGAGLVGSIASSYNDVVGAPTGGTGDFSAAVAFRDAASGDYREAAGQPSLDAGRPADDYSQEPAPDGGRINLGAFGNTALAATTDPAPPSSTHDGGCLATAAPGARWAWIWAPLLIVLRRRR